MVYTGILMHSSSCSHLSTLFFFSSSGSSNQKSKRGVSKQFTPLGVRKRGLIISMIGSSFSTVLCLVKPSKMFFASLIPSLSFSTKSLSHSGSESQPLSFESHFSRSLIRSILIALEPSTRSIKSTMLLKRNITC